MSHLDFAGTINHLMALLGEAVSVRVASATSSGPPLVVELAGTLAAGWSAEPGYADVDDVVRFGFEEHDAAFYLDREFFRGARTDETGRWLGVSLVTVGIEVTEAEDG